MNRVLTFDISLFEFKEFIDDQTALMLIKVCSSGDNLHGYPFTKETMKEAAERSLRGKPIVGRFCAWKDDFGGHDPLEIPVGYIVEHQKFQYVDNENGSSSLFAYAVLWKNYASNEYDIFVKQKERGQAPIKGVSMEVTVGLWGDGWEGDMSKKEIKKFSFKGVTILGDRYTPASPGAQAEMVSFSKTKKREIEKYFTDNSDKIDNVEDSRSLFGKAYGELGLSKNSVEKEGNIMPEPENDKKAEELKTEEVEKDMSVESEVETTAESEAETKVEPEAETKVEASVETEAEVENAETEEEETEAEPEDFKVKYEELMSKFVELEACNATYMAENKELTEYKFQREDNDKIMKIEETISKYSELLPKDAIDGYRDRIKDIKIEDVTSFCNEIKASVVDFVGVKTDTTPNRMATSSSQELPKKNKFWNNK